MAALLLLVGACTSIPPKEFSVAVLETCAMKLHRAGLAEDEITGERVTLVCGQRACFERPVEVQRTPAGAVHLSCFGPDGLPKTADDAELVFQADAGASVQ